MIISIRIFDNLLLLLPARIASHLSIATTTLPPSAASTATSTLVVHDNDPHLPGVTTTAASTLPTSPLRLGLLHGNLFLLSLLHTLLPQASPLATPNDNPSTATLTRRRLLPDLLLLRTATTELECSLQ